MSTLRDAIVHRLTVHRESDSRLKREIFEALKINMNETNFNDLEETSIVIIDASSSHIRATAYFCHQLGEPLTPHDCITLDADISQDSLVVYC